ncbi:MAG: tyrosine-protein phosphatase [Clostridia bacterium]
METVFPNLKNFRDFEGCRCNDGKRVKGNAFARSDNPRFIEEGEIAELRRRGLTTVIDLRRANEAANRPDRLASEPGFTYRHIVMNDEAYTALGPMTVPGEIADAFYSKLTVSSEHIADIFRAFAASETGVLFHCESGKDRTGTVAALLLLLNDVCDEDIIEDYRLSYDRMYVNGDPELLSDPTLIPMKETMELFLERFHRDYPVPMDYFLSIGLTQGELESIRRRFRA